MAKASVSNTACLDTCSRGTHVTAWPVTAGGAVWVCSVTLTWFFLLREEHRNPAWGLWQPCVWRLEVGTRVLQPLAGSTNGQEECSWATHCCLLTREKEGSDPVMHGSPLSSSWDPETKEIALLLMFGQPVVEQNKIKQDSPPGPPLGEGEVHSPSPDEQPPPSLGRPSQGLLHLCLPPGLAGAWTGWVSFLRLAPGRCLVEACCSSVGARAAAGGAPRWRAGWGAAAGLEAAGFLWHMMCLITSVCLCTGENCWAKLSTASSKRPVCDTGVSSLLALNGGGRFLSPSSPLSSLLCSLVLWETLSALLSKLKYYGLTGLLMQLRLSKLGFRGTWLPWRNVHSRLYDGAWERWRIVCLAALSVEDIDIYLFGTMITGILLIGLGFALGYRRIQKTGTAVQSPTRLPVWLKLWEERSALRLRL